MRQMNNKKIRVYLAAPIFLKQKETIVDIPEIIDTYLQEKTTETVDYNSIEQSTFKLDIKPERKNKSVNKNC